MSWPTQLHIKTNYLINACFSWSIYFAHKNSLLFDTFCDHRTNVYSLYFIKCKFLSIHSCVGERIHIAWENRYIFWPKQIESIFAKGIRGTREVMPKFIAHFFESSKKFLERKSTQYVKGLWVMTVFAVRHLTISAHYLRYLNVISQDSRL